MSDKVIQINISTGKNNIIIMKLRLILDFCELSSPCTYVYLKIAFNPTKNGALFDWTRVSQIDPMGSEVSVGRVWELCVIRH